MQKTLRTAERALLVLEVLNRSPSLNTSEIARVTGLSRATAFRILGTLENVGYIAREDKSKTYRLTRRVLNLSSGYRLAESISAVSQEIIRDASESLIWPLVLARPNQLEMQVLASTGFDNPFAIKRSAPGDGAPFLETASARIFIAKQNPEIQDQYFTLLRSVAADHESLEAFRADVKRAARQGYAIFQKAQSLEKAISVPIVRDEKAIAALSARFIASALSDTDAIHQVWPTLSTVAKELVSRFKIGGSEAFS